MGLGRVAMGLTVVMEVVVAGRTANERRPNTKMMVVYSL